MYTLVWPDMISQCRKIFMILCANIWGWACQDFSTFDCFNTTDGCGVETVDQERFGGSSSHMAGIEPMEEGSWEQSIDMTMLNPPLEEVPTCNIEDQPLACQTCTDGEWVNGNDDELCTEVDCTLQNQYVLEEVQDNTICQKIDYLPKTNLCDRGVCLTGMNACMEVGRRVIAESVNLRECQSIQGCRGERPPDIVSTLGASCRGGEGQCDDTGNCIQLKPPCPMSGEYFKLCSDTQSEDASCTFGVDLLLSVGLYSYVNCEDFCQTVSGRCIQAWGTSDYQQCLKGSERSCRSRIGDIICRCTF